MWGFIARADGPLVPPEAYTVRLSVDGKSYERLAQVRRDPRIAASDADLRAQYALARQVEALRAEVTERAVAQSRLRVPALARRKRKRTPSSPARRPR